MQNGARMDSGPVDPVRVRRESAAPAGDSSASLAAIKTAARAALGRLSLRDAIKVFRDEMVNAALRLRGSRRAAAKTLGVTRPAVQHILRHRGSSDSSRGRAAQGTESGRA